MTMYMYTLEGPLSYLSLPTLRSEDYAYCNGHILFLLPVTYCACLPSEESSQDFTRATS